MRSRIMYIEDKSQSLNGPARIGRVTFSKTGRTLRYGALEFFNIGGRGGLKSNYLEVESGREYWISGPRRDGRDRLYGQSTQPIEIDADVAKEYWRDIRGRGGR
ncbi:MAG TPA: hypothetical protein VGG48_03625 [Rhizomicrobium sp.]